MGGGRLSELVDIGATYGKGSLVVDYTIDSQFGDTLTHTFLLYLPAGKWARGNVCEGCCAQPDPEYAYQHNACR
jgi:hypothetical protein